MAEKDENLQKKKITYTLRLARQLDEAINYLYDNYAPTTYLSSRVSMYSLSSLLRNPFFSSVNVRASIVWFRWAKSLDFSKAWNATSFSSICC
ncbi:MAG: hypothetical protein FWF63_04235 [Fibromonadales bacterium]|nr:hypothetical protein [Fibromonadales bacterium]